MVWLAASACGGRLTLHCPGEKDKHMKRNQLEVTSKALNTESSAQASEEEKQSERTQKQKLLV